MVLLFSSTRTPREPLWKSWSLKPGTATGEPHWFAAVFGALRIASFSMLMRRKTPASPSL